MIAKTIELIAKKGHVLCRVYALFAKTFNPFPISTSVQEMIDKTNSKPTIRYMTPEEVMRYIISTRQ